jgi:hypothetical protein
MLFKGDCKKLQRRKQPVTAVQRFFDAAQRAAAAIIITGEECVHFILQAMCVSVLNVKLTLFFGHCCAATLFYLRNRFRQFKE